jgi:hypothetical protein
MTSMLAWFCGEAADEADEADAEAFEERLFADDARAAEAAQLMHVRDALRALAAQGAIVPVVLEDELRGVAARVKVSEHHARDGRIEAHITDEEFIAAHIAVDAAHVGRVHVEFCTPEGFAYFRVNEAPFDPARGEIVVLCKSHVARSSGTLRVRVLDDDARVLADVSIVNSIVNR